MPESFGTFYGNDPWEKITTNQRTWYDPLLRRGYRRDTVYANGLVPYVTQDMLPMNATEMVFNSVYDFEPTIEPAPFRHTNAAPMGLDSRQVKINFLRYLGVAAYDKYDQYITYWRNAQGGDGENNALGMLIGERLSRQMTETLDLLTRNAFLSTSYITLPTGRSHAGEIVANDKFDLVMVDDAILRARTQDVWSDTNGSGRSVSVICTPGTEYDIVTGATNSRWIELQKYTNPALIQRHEIGSYHNGRFFGTTANILWNAGAVAMQKAITASHGYKDGAPDPLTTKVDDTYFVGQPGTDSGNLKHYIQLADFAAGDYAVGDIVTIHKRKSAANTKLNAVDSPPYNDPTAVVRRVVDVNPTSNRIVLDKPLLRDFNVEVATSGDGSASPSSGVYGWVTKGLSLHAVIAIAAPGGVVCGVCQPPRVYGPRSMDLMQSYWEMGWDAFMKYQVIAPETFEVFITASTLRVKDRKLN